MSRGVAENDRLEEKAVIDNKASILDNKDIDIMIRQFSVI